MTPGTTTVDSTGLRTLFAARLSALYGTEVPAYTTLVEVVRYEGTPPPVTAHQPPEIVTRDTI